jgi:MOB kinase activator 1
MAHQLITIFEELSTIWAVLSLDPYLTTLLPGGGFPPGVEYRWRGGTAAARVSAPDYITVVLGWIETQLNDQATFPDGNDEAAFPRFLQTQQYAALYGRIFRRMFRVYAILYSSFFQTAEALRMVPHLNTSFKHFMFYGVAYGLVSWREARVIEPLIAPILNQYLRATILASEGRADRTGF